MKKRKNINRKGAIEKFCRGCETRLLAGTGGNWSESDRRSGSYVCRRCTAEQRKKTIRGRLAVILGKARQRARRKGLPATVRLRDLLPLPTTCPLLGIPLHYGPETGPGKASIDRIDNTKGYEPGNVWVVSWRANVLKSSATLDEMKRIAVALEMREVFT